MRQKLLFKENIPPMLIMEKNSNIVLKIINPPTSPTLPKAYPTMRIQASS
jgi:hypothetical protein